MNLPPTDALDLLRAVVAELVALRAEVRALRLAAERRAPAEAELVAEIEEFFGPAPFTASGVLLAADESPGLAEVLGKLVDLNAPDHARVVAVGRLLARLPGLQADGCRRGAKLYRCR